MTTDKSPASSSHSYFIVEYTSAGGRNSWFASKKNRWDEYKFETFAEAKLHVETMKNNKLNDRSRFRVTRIKMEKTYEYM